MSRTQSKLTDTAIRSGSLKAGRHSDGGGLYLNVKPSGSKSWAFMWTAAGKRREMGLGAYPTFTLAKARKLAAECRDAIAEGRDPIAERRKEEEPTFGECADMVIASMEGAWRNEKHRYQWNQTLGPSYCAKIRGRRISQIGTDDVLVAISVGGMATADACTGATSASRKPPASGLGDAVTIRDRAFDEAEAANCCPPPSIDVLKCSQTSYASGLNRLSDCAQG